MFFHFSSMFSRLFSGLLSLVFLFSLIPVSFAQSGVSVEIVFDISGSMDDLMFVGEPAEEMEELSFMPNVYAQEGLGEPLPGGDFGDLGTFEVPELEIPVFDPVALDPVLVPEVVIDDVDGEAYVDSLDSFFGEGNYKRRIEVARESLRTTLSGISPGVDVAFRTFGGSCETSELQLDFAGGNAEKIIEIADELQPFGGTPLIYAIDQARQDMEKRSGVRKIVVITDGEDTCGGDLLEVARKMKDIQLQADLIYFGGDVLYGTELQEFADIVGGIFVNATSAEELTMALEVSLATVDTGMTYNLWVVLILLILIIFVIWWARKKKVFCSLKHAVGYGVLLWVVMFVIASVLLPLKTLEGFRVLFDSVLAVFGPVVTIGCLWLYLKHCKKALLKEMVFLGILWVLIAWFLDLAFFTWGPEPMGLMQYVMEIGIKVGGIAVMVIGVGYLLGQRKS